MISSRSIWSIKLVSQVCRSNTILHILGNFAHFGKFCTFCTILHNSEHFAQFCTILHNSAHFAQFCTFCNFLHILHDFADFAQFCTILHILHNFAHFAQFFTLWLLALLCLLLPVLLCAALVWCPCVLGVTLGQIDPRPFDCCYMYMYTSGFGPAKPFFLGKSYGLLKVINID